MGYLEYNGFPLLPGYKLGDEFVEPLSPELTSYGSLSVGSLLYFRNHPLPDTRSIMRGDWDKFLSEVHRKAYTFDPISSRRVQLQVLRTNLHSTEFYQRNPPPCILSTYNLVHDPDNILRMSHMGRRQISLEEYLTFYNRAVYLPPTPSSP